MPKGWLDAKRAIRAINRPTGDAAIIFSPLFALDATTSSSADKRRFPVAPTFSRSLSSELLRDKCVIYIANDFLS